MTEKEKLTIGLRWQVGIEGLEDQPWGLRFKLGPYNPSMIGALKNVGARWDEERVEWTVYLNSINLQRTKDIVEKRLDIHTLDLDAAAETNPANYPSELKIIRKTRSGFIIVPYDPSTRAMIMRLPEARWYYKEGEYKERKFWGFRVTSNSLPLLHRICDRMEVQLPDLSWLEEDEHKFPITIKDDYVSKIVRNGSVVEIYNPHEDGLPLRPMRSISSRRFGTTAQIIAA